ncbi:hypothetical protein [Thermococcus sp. Bubb.Bath]|uniref:hypothetical protein n=1 Tax=Thermococcus sp. Bubb.Bath TaxID=1638242 RepID=UPI00143AC177|nr:hypothetical protein [Thermococcus sp. Bubb.Bath]
MEGLSIRIVLSRIVLRVLEVTATRDLKELVKREIFEKIGVTRKGTLRIKALKLASSPP